MTRASSPGAARRIAIGLLLAVAAAASAWILWGARSLVLPCLGAVLLAQACKPAITRLERWRVPRFVAMIVLVAAAGGALVGAGHAIRAVAPSADRISELKARAIQVIDARYAQLMGIDDAQPAGNDFYHLVRRETDPALAKLREFLALSPEDQLRRAPGAPLGTLAHVLPALATSFLLFVFVLMDTGTIKRGVLAAVPNRLFEPALATIGDLEAALGRYAKALFTQCVLLGSLVALALALAGIPPSWAIVIGFFAGMANVMPYAGMATAFAGSAAYVLLAADGVSAWAVLAAILVTDAIKNIVLDPMVLGGALRLHPVVIVLGVAVGAKLFGLVGALLAVPAISLGLAFAGSVTRQLRAYATA